MSRFEDPAYIAETKAGLVQYVITGVWPEGWIDARPQGNYTRRVDPALCFRDWELKAIVRQLIKGNNDYAKFAAARIPRTPQAIREKVRAEGGRESFLRKYGDL